MIAKLAYVTTPHPDRFMLIFQAFGSGELIEIEIARSHLANIVADGANLLLRESTLNRVPVATKQDAQHDAASA